MNEYDVIHNFIFDKDLKNISIREYTQLLHEDSYKIIGNAVVNGHAISTLWKGVTFDKKPFQTIIFNLYDYTLTIFEYHTEPEAKMTHDIFVQLFEVSTQESIAKALQKGRSVNEGLSEKR